MMPDMHHGYRPLTLMTVVKNYSFFPDVSPLASLNVADNISGTTINSICLPPVLPVPVTVATSSLLSHDVSHVNEISGSILCFSLHQTVSLHQDQLH